VALGRLAPAAIEHCNCRTDLGGCCGRRIVKRANERLQRLCGVVARSQHKRAEVARQRPTDRFPPCGTLFCTCTWTSAATWHFDFNLLTFLVRLIDASCPMRFYDIVRSASVE
jgi:hypothetical protein